MAFTRCPSSGRKALSAVVQEKQEIAILFGREDRGLTNEELAMANYHLTIPVNTDYGVLNVAQAIQVICYELRMAALDQVEHPRDPKATMQVIDGIEMEWDEPLVTHEQMEQFYPHLEKCWQKLNLWIQNPRLLPLRLRRLFGRIQLDRMEYHLLRGIFTRVQALNNGTWKNLPIHHNRMRIKTNAKTAQRRYPSCLCARSCSTQYLRSLNHLPWHPCTDYASHGT